MLNYQIQHSLANMGRKSDLQTNIRVVLTKSIILYYIFYSPIPAESWTFTVYIDGCRCWVIGTWQADIRQNGKRKSELKSKREEKLILINCLCSICYRDGASQYDTTYGQIPKVIHTTHNTYSLDCRKFHNDKNDYNFTKFEFLLIEIHLSLGNPKNVDGRRQLNESIYILYKLWIKT